MKKSSRGFTLVELVIVVAIIIILAAITISVYSGTQARSRDAKRKADIANITKAMELYYDDNGQYPTSSGSTAINPGWVSSNDDSWANLESQLVGSNAIDKLPKDPVNLPNTKAAGAGVTSSVKSNLSYAIYVNSGNYCGSAPRQMYLILYRLETGEKAQQSDGSPCNNVAPNNTTDLGPNYTNAYGVSFYRYIR